MFPAEMGSRSHLGSFSCEVGSRPHLGTLAGTLRRDVTDVYSYRTVAARRWVCLRVWDVCGILDDWCDEFDLYTKHVLYAMTIASNGRADRECQVVCHMTLGLRMLRVLFVFDCLYSRVCVVAT